MAAEEEEYPRYPMRFYLHVLRPELHFGRGAIIAKMVAIISSGVIVFPSFYVPEVGYELCLPRFHPGDCTKCQT
jgi:hypothetical protein